MNYIVAINSTIKKNGKTANNDKFNIVYNKNK